MGGDLWQGRLDSELIGKKRTGLKKAADTDLLVLDATLLANFAPKGADADVSVCTMKTVTKTTTMFAPVAAVVLVLKCLVAKAVAAVALTATAMTERRAGKSAEGR